MKKKSTIEKDSNVEIKFQWEQLLIIWFKEQMSHFPRESHHIHNFFPNIFLIRITYLKKIPFDISENEQMLKKRENLFSNVLKFTGICSKKRENSNLFNLQPIKNIPVELLVKQSIIFL